MTMPAQKPGRSKQDYGTPPEFLSAVRYILGINQFDVDLAASRDNAVADLYYDIDADSLKQDWKVGNGWNWLNPPFANINKWVAKAQTESTWGARTAVLIPAGVGSNWWRDWVHEKAQVLFLNGRITFLGTPINPKTGKVDPYPKDCALLLYSAKPGYSVWTWPGDVVD